MNKDKLKSIISKKARGDSALSGQLYQMYFFEHILDRISKSKYKHNIILKGGLLLSSIIGNDMRTTKDMDATLKSVPLKKNVLQIIEEILSIDLNDGISFQIKDIKDIRQESEYGGFRLNILSCLSTVKVYLSIEFTTGDKITPREIEYHYHSQFEERDISIFAYTIETVLAEKYQTIVVRDIYNTRMKDFYDIYILIRDNKEKIDFKNFVMAIHNTFKNRDTALNIDDIRKQFDSMKTNEQLRKLWRNYQVTAPYSSGISFENLFDALDYITNILSNEMIVV